MHGSVTRSTLKDGRKRTVFLERWTEAGRERGRVTKHFHDPGPLGFLRDWGRARSEYRALCQLERAGVRVPHPQALRRVGRGWQVVMDWLPDTTSLEQWIDGARPAHLPAEHVAEAVGGLAAALQTAGLDHTDLHAGNVLFDAEGHAWMIDFHQARVRSHLPAARAVEHLVAATARGREAMSRGFRARAFLAWWRELPPGLRDALPPRNVLAAEIEERARVLRRREVEADERRWVRAGGFLREARIGGLRVLWPRIVSEALVRALAEEVSGSGERGVVTVEGGDGAERCLVVGGTDAQRTMRTWMVVGRLWQHRVPVLPPVAWAANGSVWAAWSLPEGAESLRAVADREPEAAERRRVARELGRLVGTLHDRGLQVPGVDLGELYRQADGRLACGPATELAEIDPRPARAPRRFEGLLPDLVSGASRLERAAFLAGYVAAFAEPEARDLRAELVGEGAAR